LARVPPKPPKQAAIRPRPKGRLFGDCRALLRAKQSDLPPRGKPDVLTDEPGRLSRIQCAVSAASMFQPAVSPKGTCQGYRRQCPLRIASGNPRLPEYLRSIGRADLGLFGHHARSPAYRWSTATSKTCMTIHTANRGHLWSRRGPDMSPNWQLAKRGPSASSLRVSPRDGITKENTLFYRHRGTKMTHFVGGRRLAGQLRRSPHRVHVSADR